MPEETKKPTRPDLTDLMQFFRRLTAEQYWAAAAEVEAARIANAEYWRAKARERGTQLSFDFGTWGVAADAIGRAMAKSREARQLTAQALAKAQEATRADRRASLEREDVCAWWSDLAGDLVIFDGSLKHTRSFRGHWSVGHLSRGTEWNLQPWTLWTPVDVGTIEFARLLAEGRFHAKMMASIKMLPRDLCRKVASRLGE